MFYHWTKRIKGKTPFNKQKKIWFNYLLYKLLFNYTSNQIRTDDIYLEGRGYTNLTILVLNIRALPDSNWDTPNWQLGTLPIKLRAPKNY